MEDKLKAAEEVMAEPSKEEAIQSQVGEIVEKMFQDESDRIINEEDPDAKRGKRATLIIALVMGLVVLLTLIYRIL